jgi:hypothetical protein
LVGEHHGNHDPQTGSGNRASLESIDSIIFIWEVNYWIMRKFCWLLFLHKNKVASRYATFNG